MAKCETQAFKTVKTKCGLHAGHVHVLYTVYKKEKGSDFGCGNTIRLLGLK